MPLVPTASQTVGPYFSLGLDWENGHDLVGEATEGERITIEGRVLDGDREPVGDAMIEIWQANSHGRYAHPEDRQNKPLDPDFKGFGRAGTDGEGRFRFFTIKPGPVPAPGGGLQAPHVVVGVFARGLLKRLATRIYFDDEAANADDPVLGLIEDPDRRATLIARRERAGVYRFDIVLRGDDETVFFDA